MRHLAPVPVTLLLGVCAALPAAASTSDAAARLAPSLAVPAGPSPVLTEIGEDGAVHALGEHYKLSVAHGAVLFHPIVGARAARSPHLDLTLHRATVGGAPISMTPEVRPQLDDDRVLLDHGAIVAEFVLAPGGVEQSFLLPGPLGRGDLVLRLGATTVARPLGRDAQGLRFDADGVGVIRYGDVTVFDARGRSWSLESTLDDGAITLTVPAAVLAAARFPVRVDPPVTFVNFDSDADDDEDPDVAYDRVQNKYLVVYERVINASDRDVISRRFDADGTFLEQVAVDISGADTVDPAVAAATGEFLVVWNHRGGVITDNVIRGRTRQAGTTNQGAAFDISAGSSNEENPDVGGSPNPVTHPFLVAWDERPLLGTRHVKGRRVSSAGAVAAEIAIAATGDDEFRPVVSRNAGAAGRWVILWEEQDAGAAGTFLGARAIRDDGSLVQTLLNLGTHPGTEPFDADVDGDGDVWLAAFETPDTNDASVRDIQAVTLTIHPTGSLFRKASTNLSKLAISSVEQVDQRAPAVIAEGCRFVVAYLRESAGTQKIDVHTAIVAHKAGVSAEPLTLIEGDDQITGGSLANHRDLVGCSTAFDEPGQFLLAWTRQVNLASDNVEGALFSALAPGGLSTLQTGCGAPEPVLLTTASPVIGGSFGFVMLGFSSNAPLLFLGAPLAAPVPFCAQGCALGVTPQLVFNVPLFVQGQVPCDPALLGFSLGAQAIDILAPNDPGVSCGPPAYAQRFRSTDTLVLKFQ